VTESIRVLVVDDQPLVRAGLVAILTAQPDLEVVGEASDGAEAVERVAATHPDVVMMDVRMRGVDGIEATRMLRDDPCRVLVLTTFDIDEHVHAALRAGAVGYLLKDASPEALVDAVRAAARDETSLAPEVLRRLVADLVTRPGPGTVRPERLAGLSPREIEVLLLIARGRSNGEIASDLVVSEATVKTHVARLLAKLRLRDRAQAVAVAYEAGLVVPGSGEG
jgi:DNA-binding NarL/FixJ family response regulator